MAVSDAFLGFNTQPPEGGCSRHLREPADTNVSTHSRPKAAALKYKREIYIEEFQHTAARRRLRNTRKHSANPLRFNTQPPEGG